MTWTPRATCKDCGTSDGMGWSLERGYKSNGSHGARCHPCYLTYCGKRSSSTARLERLKVANAARPPRARKPPRFRTITCGDCLVTFDGRMRSTRCPDCQEARTTVQRNRSHALRKRAYRTDPSINWRTVGERDGWRCHLCGGGVEARTHPSDPYVATVDHLVPLAHGGEHVPANVALAHRLCNSKRGARLLVAA